MVLHLFINPRSKDGKGTAVIRKIAKRDGAKY